MRARWVKPEFFKDPKIAAMGPVTALVYQALWCMADDGGTAPCDPDIIKGEMFTRWSAVGVPEITGALRTLFEARRIRFHRTDDEWFCTILRFGDHQAVHKPSKFRFSLSRNGFRDAVPEWCSTGEEPPPDNTGTPHIPDTQTPRHPSSSSSGSGASASDGQEPRLLARFDFDDAITIRDFLDAVDPSVRSRWVAILDAWAGGGDLPPVPKVILADIPGGLRAFLAEYPEPGRPKPNLVQGYVRDVARKRLDPPEAPARPPSAAAGPSGNRDAAALEELRAVRRAIGAAGGVRNLTGEVYEGLSAGGKAAWREVGGASAIADCSTREAPFMERRWCQAYRSVPAKEAVPA